jgi:hypothetical protein
LNQHWTVWDPTEFGPCGLGDRHVLSELGKGQERTQVEVGSPTGE